MKTKSLKICLKPHRLWIIVLLIIFFGFSTTSYSQNALQTTARFESTTPSVRSLLETLSAIESLHLSYSENTFNMNAQIHLPSRQMTVIELLDLLSEKLNMEYQFHGKQIIFKQKQKEQYTLSGYIRDGATGEELIGATIQIEELETTGTATNAYGFYSITIPEGDYTVTARYLGFKPRSLEVTLNHNTRQDFNLQEEVRELEEVVVTSQRDDELLETTTMGIEKLDMQEVVQLPVIGGERDILKAIQLMPGVQASNEAGAGFHVRGGSVGQNLILLDEATVYNASHLMGFFSVFNSDVLKDVTLYKGNIPAEYGGRLASVLDIKMNEGNNQSFQAEGGIGLIASKLNIQGPIVKNRGSFMLSGRRTYADLFLKFAGDQVSDNQLYFYDFNTKANYRINENNRIFLSGYFGRDNLNLSDQYYLKWGNATGTLRWNHLFNDKLFSNTSLIYSNYNYQTANNPGGNIEYTNSLLQDFNLKQAFEFYSAFGTLRFGLNSTYHQVDPVVLTNSGGEKTGNTDEQHVLENAVYASHEVSLNQSVKINYGLRFNAFSILGPGDFYSFNDSGQITDTLSYNKRSIIKNYLRLEPRVGINLRLNDKNSFKIAYGRTTQNMHLLSASNVSEPTDLWLPSSLHIKPETSDQFSVGFFRNFAENQFEFSTEAYYKILGNQLGLRDGAQLESNPLVESEVIRGEGRGYGIEFLLRKRTGNLTGWLAYTLSRTERKFDQINGGQYFPAKQDRTHDISIVAIHQLNKKWSLSANWVYYTGNAVTFPNGKYKVGDRILNYYTGRNQRRMPDFHRLDIGATWQRKKTERFESSWTFSLYNAYGRQIRFLSPSEKAKPIPQKQKLFKPLCSDGFLHLHIISNLNRT